MKFYMYFVDNYPTYFVHFKNIWSKIKKFLTDSQPGYRYVVTF